MSSSVEDGSGTATGGASSITVTPILVGDLFVGADDRMPVYVHVIDHPDVGVPARHRPDPGAFLVVADMDPRLHPLTEQDVDLAAVDLVVNTHLHFDHCGGNHLFAGRPIYVQRRELEDARRQEDRPS